MLNDDDDDDDDAGDDDVVISPENTPARAEDTVDPALAMSRRFGVPPALYRELQRAEGGRKVE